MKVYTTPQSFIFEYFPEARETGVSEDKEKGFRVQYGEVKYMNKFHAVPMWIEYFKDKFNYTEAKHFAQQITTCDICEKINANVGIIENIEERKELQDNYVKPYSTEPQTAVLAKLERLSEDVNELKSKTNTSTDEAENLYLEMIMDVTTATMTPPGLIEVAILTKNPKLLRKILPKSEEEKLALKAEMSEYLAGDIGRVRTKDQMREYAKLQRDMIKLMHGQEIEEEPEVKKAKFVPKVRGQF